MNDNADAARRGPLWQAILLALVIGAISGAVEYPINRFMILTGACWKHEDRNVNMPGIGKVRVIRASAPSFPAVLILAAVMLTVLLWDRGVGQVLVSIPIGLLTVWLARTIAGILLIRAIP